MEFILYEFHFIKAIRLRACYRDKRVRIGHINKIFIVIPVENNVAFEGLHFTIKTQLKVQKELFRSILQWKPFQKILKPSKVTQKKLHQRCFCWSQLRSLIFPIWIGKTLWLNIVVMTKDSRIEIENCSPYFSKFTRASLFYQ